MKLGVLDDGCVDGGSQKEASLLPAVGQERGDVETSEDEGRELRLVSVQRSRIEEGSQGIWVGTKGGGGSEALEDPPGFHP